jgi:hypothetical protein
LSSGYRELTGDDIRELLGELLDRLARRGVEVEVYLVGGAAMALHLGRDELTPGIDGIFVPKEEVFAEAKAMAGEYGLDPQWVNSAFVAFMSFSPKDDIDAVVIDLRGHKVTIASKRVLLAMKIAASRPKDYTDTNRLILDLGINDANEIVDLALSVFGEGNMTVSEDRAEVKLLAEEALRRAKRYGAGVGPTGITDPVPAGRHISDVSAGRCSVHMPRARRACILKVGHGGHHRSQPRR